MMRKISLCLTYGLAFVGCLLMSASVSAQSYSLGSPAGPGCGCDGGGFVGPGCGPNGGGMVGPGCGANGGGMVGPGCGANSGGMVGPGCGANNYFDPGMVGPGCGANGGMLGPGCGADGGCGGGCGGSCFGGQRGGLGNRLRRGNGLGMRGGMRRGMRRGMRNRGGCFYLSADIGWSVLDSPAEVVRNNVAGQPQFDIDDDLVGRVGIGRYFGNWRLESEVGFREYNLDQIVRNGGNFWEANGSRKSTTSMVNFFRDFNCNGRIRPYAKGGVGVSYNENSGQLTSWPAGAGPTTTNFPQSDTYELAWSVGGGLGICLTERLILDLEYQYIELGATASGLNGMGSRLGFGDGWGHELTMGLRVNF